MADVQLRFHKDMLVISSPIKNELERLGVNAERDTEIMLLIEPEVLEDVYKLEQFAGAQCLTTFTADFTPAQMARRNMQKNADALARAALDIVCGFRPQHVLVEIGPCGLPLDVSSKQSLNESCDQYKRAANLFSPYGDKFDAFFLNNFTRVADLKCALIGMQKITDKPIFASVNVDEQGQLRLGETLEEAVSVMAEYGASVVGIQTSAAPDSAAQLLMRAKNVSYLPLLAQLEVHGNAAFVSDIEKGEDHVADEQMDEIYAAAQEVMNEPGVRMIDVPKAVFAQEDSDETSPYAQPDSMIEAADVLRAAGVQFLRATGNATPAYTGALVAATEGTDVAGDDSEEEPEIVQFMQENSLESVADRLRAKVNTVLPRSLRETRNT